MPRTLCDSMPCAILSKYSEHNQHIKPFFFRFCPKITSVLMQSPFYDGAMVPIKVICEDCSLKTKKYCEMILTAIIYPYHSEHIIEQRSMLYAELSLNKNDEYISKQQRYSVGFTWCC